LIDAIDGTIVQSAFALEIGAVDVEFLHYLISCEAEGRDRANGRRGYYYGISIAHQDSYDCAPL
jgi:hypothetical protein